MWITIGKIIFNYLNGRDRIDRVITTRTTLRPRKYREKLRLKELTSKISYTKYSLK
jgi:hypothetical protein